MNTRNYQRELDNIIMSLGGGAGDIPRERAPRLLLHACCAPCASYCIEYLSQYFEIALLFFNPNIGSGEEYDKRAAELGRLIGCMEEDGVFERGRVRLDIAPYKPELFYEAARGLESAPERGERCYRCYGLRLGEAATQAAVGGFDYFTTTLSISPLKNAAWINEIGEKLAEQFGVAHLPSDFKKRGGYQRSIELSKRYGLYRQNYCGCVYSVNQQIM